MLTFTEVATQAYVLRYPMLDVNSTLIVGAEVAAVVDTLSTDAQAAELLAAVRRITALPLVVINTHAHFDHSFGNSVVGAAPGTSVWGHEAAAALLRDHGPRHQREWYDEWLPAEPDLAAGLAAVTIRPPDRTVHTESIMDLGGRSIALHHFGRGHTDGDLCVLVPDVSLLVAGDLIEQGAPPAFGDSYPIDWPDTVAAMLHRAEPDRVVPGHGEVVDAEFVRHQHTELSTLAWLIREGHADGADAAAVVAKAPFGPEAARVAVARGYAELDGRT